MSSQKENIIVDATLLDAISNEEKEKITKIMQHYNLLSQEASVERSTSPLITEAQSVIANPQSLIGDFWDDVKKPLCKAACDTAAAAAAAACTAETAGLALAVCLAAAKAARDVCQDAC